MAFFIGDITGVNRFLINCDTLDMCKCLTHGHIGGQAHILRGHKGTGSIAVVFEKAVECQAVFGRRVLYDTLYNCGGHLLNNIGGIVEVQLLKVG